jgi:hypothetical protein
MMGARNIRRHLNFNLANWRTAPWRRQPDLRNTTGFVRRRTDTSAPAVTEDAADGDDRNVSCEVLKVLGTKGKCAGTLAACVDVLD